MMTFQRQCHRARDENTDQPSQNIDSKSNHCRTINVTRTVSFHALALKEQFNVHENEIARDYMDSLLTMSTVNTYTTYEYQPRSLRT